MAKEDVENAMLDGLINGLNVQSEALSRLSKINELMPLIRTKSDLVKIELDSPKAITYSEDFLDGYESRITVVWHPANEEPVKPQLLLIEHNDGEFELEYRFDPATTRRWTCVKDLIPSKEE